MNEKECGLADIQLHFALSRAEEAMSLSRWPEVIRQLEEALAIAHRINGDSPEWVPQHGGQPRPLTRDPFAEEVIPGSLVPPPDLFGDEE